jgi:predicted RND superfamily exporter protein
MAPLHDIDPETRKPLDYGHFAEKLEKIRTQFQKDGIKIHITGFAKIVGDLVDGLGQVMLFFFLALVVMIGILFNNSRSWRVTILRGIKSIMAVVWQLGIMHLLGYGLNLYSILVPFLIFAIGVSHGIQFFNAMAHEMIGGADKLKAARLGYRQIYKPGLAALFTDFLGFASLFIIRIGVIQDIAVGASIGIAVVAVTDLTILPIMMSYVGISEKTIKLIKKREEGTNHPVWSFLTKFTHRGYANTAIIIAVIGLASGIYLRQDLKIGDLDPGAPELHPDSRYNKDNAYMNDHYSVSSDVFVVMMKTPPAMNSAYPAVVAMDRLAWKLIQLEGVQNVKSQVDFLKRLNSAFTEGNLKWMALPRSKIALDNMTLKIPQDFQKHAGELSPLLVFLDDHKAETLKRVVDVVDIFARENNSEAFQFLMAAGNAGIEAATNIEVEKTLILLTLLVYTVVFLTCLITFRSFKGALCVVTPLFLTSVLCEALMAKMGIGVKVSTLPVIAVGVGIGVDYGIYIYSKMLNFLNQGNKLSAAYYRTLNTTGRAVSFTGITLSIGVATWAFSPIKFQADMGLLLIFMFLWNMVGATVLLPAMARLLMRIWR